MKREIKRKCNLCNNHFTGDYTKWLEHGKIHHPDYFLQGWKDGCKTPNPKFYKKYAYNPLTNNWFSCTKYLARELTEIGISNEDYYVRYAKNHMVDLWKLNEYDEKYGNSKNVDKCLHCNKIIQFNNGKWHYPIFCGSSCSASWHFSNTNRIEKAQHTIKEKMKEDPNFWLRPNQKEYWIERKGLSEEEALIRVSERQSVNTIESYISREGEEGINSFKDRQNRWIETMKQTGGFNNYSKISEELFDILNEHISGLYYGKNESKIELDKSFIKPDCLYGNKIIEFFGDFWHGNPAVYDENKIIDNRKGLTRRDINERDAKRIEELKNLGYDVMVVWEKDYRSNKSFIIDKCLKFLKE